MNLKTDVPLEQSVTELLAFRTVITAYNALKRPIIYL